VHVLDAVLRAIEAGLAVHPAERGGALLGPRGRPLVTHFEPDPEGASTAVSWRPSRALDARVKALERDDDLELKGLVHSHPPGQDQPSERDAEELGEGLRRNGHLACYLGPIVTAGGAGAPLEPHEAPLPSGKIAFFAGWRAPGGEGPAQVRPVHVTVLPLLRDVEAAAAALGAAGAEVSLSWLGEVPLPSGRLELPGLGELLVLASETYPALPPLALVTPPGGAPHQLHLDWPIDTPEAGRLARAVRAALDRHGARGAGAEAVRAGLLARTAGLLSPALAGRTVLVAGCGSVGSYVAEQLVRSGVGALVLVDPEPVEAANLSRTVYEAADVGSPKVEALAARLLRIQPGLRLERHARPLDALAPEALDAAVRGADLVVAATDDPAAQRILNRFAHGRGRPALFPGLHAGARGGEVVVTVPGRTPCYLCATRTRGAERAGPASRELDYGTGRLRGEVALGADIQHVASAAVKLGLSLLLSPGAGEGRLAAFAEAPLAAGTPFLTLSMVADYWFYPEVFGDTPGQGPYQAVWLAAASDPGCAVCGEPAGRVDPLDVPLRPPDRAELAALLGE
jgi:proteasome lid subunit RPN8/RPN11